METPSEHLGQFLSTMDIRAMENILRINSNEPKDVVDLVVSTAERLIPGIKTEVLPFPVGDYIYRDMVFERKSLDFGNYPLIKQQCTEMLANFKRVYLLVDTTIDDVLVSLFNNNPSKAEGLNGFIASLTVMGVVPIFCSTTDYFAEIMVKIMIKGYDQKDRLFTDPVRPQVSDSDEVLHIVKSISGISTVRGRKLLERFRTISGVASASVEDLSSVDGIGPKTAQGIYDAFRKEWRA